MSVDAYLNVSSMASDYVIGRSGAAYDNLGQEYQSIAYNQPGTVAIVTNYFCDNDGNVIETVGGGSQEFAKVSYDGLDEPVTTYSGYDPTQPAFGTSDAWTEANTLDNDVVLSQSTTDYDPAGDATFANLPQTPGEVRTFTVYGYAAGTPSSDSYSVTDGGGTITKVSGDLSASTPLGGGWYDLGTVSLTSTDISSTLSFTGLDSAFSQLCIVQPSASATYTPTGEVATTTDADGNTTSLAYDAVGNETSETDPAATSGGTQPVTSYVNDADGRVTAIIDPLGNVTAYGYQMGSSTDTVTTSQGQMLAPTTSDDTASATFNNLAQAPGVSTGRTYTLYALSSSDLTTDAPSITLSDGLSLEGSVSAATPLGTGWYKLGTVTIYDTSSSLTVGYTTGGATITNFALLSKTESDTYDANGNLTSTTDALGNTTAYSYNALGLPAQASSDGHELGPKYDKDGNVVSDTDLQNGYVTEYEVNMLGDTVETIDPNATTGATGGGPVTTDDYDADGELLSETDAEGNTTTAAYDAFGDQVSQTDPLGNTTYSTFDLDGEQIRQVDPQGNVTTDVFSPYGDEISQTLPELTTGAGTGGPTTTYTFDLNHNMLSLTDPDGNTTTWTYNGQGLEATQTQTVALGYNSDSTVDTTTATTTDSYDLDGNLSESVDPDGRAITYSYDSQNNEVGENWYSSTTLSDPTNTVALQYDADGNMLAASNNAAAYTFQYDTVGNVTGENITLAGLPSDKNVILLSGYDYNDNRTSLKANIGGTLNSDDTVSGGINDFQDAAAYDALGDMTSLTQTGQTSGTDNGVTPKNVTFSRDADQRTSVINMYQSADTSVLVASAASTYDADSDLTDLTYTDASSNTLAAYHWVYDTDGEVTDEYSYADTSDTTDRTSASSTWAHTTYGYDHDAELTSTGYANFANASEAQTTDASTSQSQTYDSNGNRASTTDVSTPSGGGSATTTSTAPASSTNLLLFDGTYYYNYDPAGNRTAKFESTSGLLDSSARNITIYAWNNANELVSAKTYDTYAHYFANATPSSEVDNTYDPFNEMVSNTVKNSSGTVTSNENYIYDGTNVALVLNSSGRVTERELYAPAVDQILASEVVTPGISGAQSAGTVSWMLPDNQGTIRDVVQYASGATTLVDHIVYDAFGTITYQSDSAYQPRFTYAGMQLDTVTGLYYDDMRWYDSNNSIFVSQDPIGYLDGGTNLAMYGANSPTNYIDPTGTVSMPWENDQPAFPIQTYDSNGALQIPHVDDSIHFQFTPPPSDFHFQNNLPQADEVSPFTFNSITQSFQSTPSFRPSDWNIPGFDNDDDELNSLLLLNSLPFKTDTTPFPFDETPEYLFEPKVGLVAQYGSSGGGDAPTTNNLQGVINGTANGVWHWAGLPGSPPIGKRNENEIFPANALFDPVPAGTPIGWNRPGKYWGKIQINPNTSVGFGLSGSNTSILGTQAPIGGPYSGGVDVEIKFK